MQTKFSPSEIAGMSPMLILPPQWFVFISLPFKRHAWHNICWCRKADLFLSNLILKIRKIMKQIYANSVTYSTFKTTLWWRVVCCYCTFCWICVELKFLLSNMWCENVIMEKLLLYPEMAQRVEKVLGMLVILIEKSHTFMCFSRHHVLPIPGIMNSS